MKGKTTKLTGSEAIEMIDLDQLPSDNPIREQLAVLIMKENENTEK